MAQAFTEYRDVIVTFDDGTAAQEAMSLDAYKAALKKVSDIEDQYAADPTSVVDLTDVTVVFTGTSRYKLYSFQLTLDISAANYEFVWNETVPNADSLS